MDCVSMGESERSYVMTVVTKTDLFGEEYTTKLIRCIHCGCDKEESEIAVRVVNKSGENQYRNECKQCLGKKNRILVRLKKIHPDPSLHNPNYQCPICERTQNEILGKGSYSTMNIQKESVFVLDHDHKTGQFRGYPCDRCNTAMGAINDDIKSLARMVLYLNGELENCDVSKHKNVW